MFQYHLLKILRYRIISDISYRSIKLTVFHKRFSNGPKLNLSMWDLKIINKKNLQ